MKVAVKVSERVTVEGEGDSHTEVFESLAGLQEVFGEKECGKCKGSNLRFIVRNDEDKNKYYELHCLDTKCRAKLAYGVAKKGGGLFPKRYETQDGEKVKVDGKNKMKGSFGWTRWNFDKKIEE